MPLKRYIRPFANNATATTDIQFIPDSGSDATAVNYQTGYNARYALQYGINPQALPVERQYFNGLMYEITGNLQDWQLRCIPEWFDYTGTTSPALTYNTGSVVRWRSGTTGPFGIYRCLAEGTLTNPTDTTKWERVLTVKEILGYMGLVNQYPDPATVPNTGDFNNVPFPTGFRCGIINFDSDARAQAWLNAPPTQSTARTGTLETFSYMTAYGVYSYMQRYSDRSGAVYARSYDIATSTWTTWINLTLRGGAVGGGDDKIFYLNDQAVNVNYNIPSNQNAVSAGPITINNGVTVTIPDGSTWTVV